MYKYFIQRLTFSAMSLCLLSTLVVGMEMPEPTKDENDAVKCQEECTAAARMRNEKITHDVYKNPRQAKFYEKAAGNIGRAWFYCEQKCKQVDLSGGFPEDTKQQQPEDFYLPEILKKPSRPKVVAQRSPGNTVKFAPSTSPGKQVIFAP